MMIAGKLAKDTHEIAKNNGFSKIVTFVCQKPIVNKRSANLLSRFGFDVLQDVSIGDGVVLRAYKLDL